MQKAVEHITGKDLEQLIEEEIFKPLQMNNSALSWTPAVNNQLSYTFDSEGRMEEKRTHSGFSVCTEPNAACYSRPEALKAGFDFYRSFELDEQENIKFKDIDVNTPVLYLRGGDEHIDITRYMKGFKENNIKSITSTIIENCGHFSAEEQPQKIAIAIGEFIS